MCTLFTKPWFLYYFILLELNVATNVINFDKYQLDYNIDYNLTFNSPGKHPQKKISRNGNACTNNIDSTETRNNHEIASQKLTFIVIFINDALRTCVVSNCNM